MLKPGLYLLKLQQTRLAVCTSRQEAFERTDAADFKFNVFQCDLPFCCWTRTIMRLMAIPVKSPSKP